MKRIPVIFFTLAVLASSCFRPLGLYVTGGNDLDQRIRTEKLTVAVLPAIDYTYAEKKYGWLMGPDPVIVERIRYYEDPGLVFTNEITRCLWKRNSCSIVKKEALISEMDSMRFSAEELFPDPGRRIRKLSRWDRVLRGGKGSPDYRKIYALGEMLEADIVLISRVYGTMDRGYVFYEPNLRGDTRIRDFTRNPFYIDMIFLDVNRKEPLAYGTFSYLDQINDSNKEMVLEYMSKGVTYYMPEPDLSERLVKGTAAILSQMLAEIPDGTSRGRVDLKFSYEFKDETWKTYPEGYFEENHALSREEYQALFRR